MHPGNWVKVCDREDYQSALWTDCYYRSGCARMLLDYYSVVSNWGHAHHPFWGDRVAPIEILTKGCERAMAEERVRAEGIDLTAPRTPQSSTPKTSLEWEKLSEMEMSSSHFFGPDPIQRIARGDQETFFEVAPTLENLGIAVGPMVVNKLDRIMKVRLTALRGDWDRRVRFAVEVQ